MTDQTQKVTLNNPGLTPKIVQVAESTSYLWPAADLHGILQTILEQLDQLIDCDACAIFLVTDDSLRHIASWGLPEATHSEPITINLQQPDLQHLIHSEQPVVLQDVAPVDPFEGMLNLGNMHGCIAAPMVFHGRTIGVLLVFKEEPDCYSKRDAQSAIALANQAAAVIEHARLYSETRRRALQLEAVSQVSQKVASILEMDELFSQVVRLIHDVFGYYGVHIFHVDGRANEIVLRESSGHADESLKKRGLRLKIGKEGITGWVAASGQSLLCNDVRQELRFHPHELLPETQSELAVPLRVGEVVVGVLDVQSTDPNAFHEDDVTALQILADQVAVAIENAHLFERTRHQYAAMHALHDISLDISSQLESGRVLEVILERATHLLNTHGSTLGIYDSEAKVIRQVAVHNVPPEVEGVELQLGEGVAGQVVASGEPLIINDYRAWAKRSLQVPDGPLTAIIGVPLRWQGQVIGVLDVLDQGDRRSFNDDDVQLLSLFADLASIALKNADLYAEVRQAGEQLEHKVERRTRQLARAQEALTKKAEELQRLLQVTVQVQEEERTRIARDLHDGSNQLITGALYEIQAAQQSLLNGRKDNALETLETAKDLLRRIEAENRRIISGLRPAVLDTQGLVPALQWHVNTFLETYPIACTLRVSGHPVRLAAEIETAVYRIVQESLNNVATHAQAREFQIQIAFRPMRLRVDIEDNGIGFDYERALTDAAGRMGLIGIRERAQSIGGHVEIQSIRGQGTRITLEVPLPTQNTPGIQTNNHSM